MPKNKPRFYLDEIRRATIAAKEAGVPIEIVDGKIRILTNQVDNDEDPIIDAGSGSGIELLWLMHRANFLNKIIHPQSAFLQVND